MTQSQFDRCPKCDRNGLPKAESGRRRCRFCFAASPGPADRALYLACTSDLAYLDKDGGRYHLDGHWDVRPFFSRREAEAYLQGLKIAPASRVLLHKLLESFTEQRQWRKAIETLDSLSGLEESPERRARFHYTAAVIARDELRDYELTVEKFSAALDDAPTTPKAFDGIEKVLQERKDWKNLARAYRRQLKRMGEDAEVPRLLELWTKLGDVCADHLNDTEAATEAYQVATELAPDDIARHEQLDRRLLRPVLVRAARDSDEETKR